MTRNIPPPRRPTVFSVSLRALLQVAVTIVIAVFLSIVVAGLRQLAPPNDIVDTVLRILVFAVAFVVVPPAIAQRGGWRSERMERLGCWMLFLGPIGWFILYCWREASDQEAAYVRASQKWVDESNVAFRSGR